MPSQNKEVLCTYHYDPLDCLIGLKSAKEETYQRFYCKSRLATEIQCLVRCSIMQQNDQLLAQQNRLGETLETALLATDQQRSVRYTVGGSPLPMVYSPYGHLRAESGFTSLLGFGGERPDEITGHYLLGNGHRAFNPVLMRFNSPDRLSPFEKGGINAYAYCLGDPINRSDPTGSAGIWFMLSTKALQGLSKKAKTSSGGIFEEFVKYKPIQNVSESLKNPLSKSSLQHSQWRAAPRDVMKDYKPPITSIESDKTLMESYYQWSLMVSDASRRDAYFKLPGHHELRLHGMLNVSVLGEIHAASIRAPLIPSNIKLLPPFELFINRKSVDDLHVVGFQLANVRREI